MKKCLIHAGESLHLPDYFVEAKQLIPGDRINVEFDPQQLPQAMMLRGDNTIYIPEEYNELRFQVVQCRWSWRPTTPPYMHMDPIKRKQFRAGEPVIKVTIPKRKGKKVFPPERV